MAKSSTTNIETEKWKNLSTVYVLDGCSLIAIGAGKVKWNVHNRNVIPWKGSLINICVSNEFNSSYYLSTSTNPAVTIITYL